MWLNGCANSVSGSRSARRAPHVFKLVLGQGVILIGIGILIGLVGAAGASRALTAVLYGVGALNLAAFALAVFVSSSSR